MAEIARSWRESPRRLKLALIAAPAAWAMQLILSWIVVSFSCAEGATATPIGESATRAVLVAFDVVALLICVSALAVGLAAWRGMSKDAGITAVHGREPADFLAAAALLVAAVFTMAALLQAVPTFSLPVCSTFQ